MNNFHDLDRYLDGLIVKAEDRIVSIYAKALRGIRSEIAEMYERYAVGEKLSLADMTKFNRLDRQIQSIVEQMVGVYGEAKMIAQKTMEEQFLENYYRTGYMLEYSTQQELGFNGAIDPTAVEESLANPISGLKLDDVLEKNRTLVIYQLQQEITLGLVRGEPYNLMMARIRNTYNWDAAKAQRVVRTEAGRAQTLGRNHSLDLADQYTDRISRYWDAALDKKTRPRHQALDGQKADEEGYFHSRGDKAQGPHLFGIAAMDINCRCAVRPEVDNRPVDMRRARVEIKEGKRNTIVIPYATYEEWFEGRIG